MKFTRQIYLIDPNTEMEFHRDNSDIYHSRTAEDNQLLEEIKEFGVVEPIHIVGTPAGHKLLVSGHRRVPLARLAEVENIPTIFHHPDEWPSDPVDQQYLLTMFNRHRHKSPSELWKEAQIIKARMEKMNHKPGGRTAEYLAEQVGIGSSRTYERLDFVQQFAPDKIKEKLDKGELSIAQAYNQTRTYTAAPKEAQPKIEERLNSGAAKNMDQAAEQVRQETNAKLVKPNEPDKMLDQYDAIVLMPNWDLSEVGLSSTGPRGWYKTSTPVINSEQLIDLHLAGRHISAYLNPETIVYLIVPHQLLFNACDVINQWGTAYNCRLTWCFPGVCAGRYGYEIHKDHSADILVAYPNPDKYHDVRGGNWFQAPWKDGELPAQLIKMVEAVKPGGTYLQVYTQTDIPGWHRA